MKSYKERTNDILMKRDQYYAVKKKKWHLVYAVSSMFACMFLILGGVLVIPHLKNQNSSLRNVAFDSTTSQPETIQEMLEDDTTPVLYSDLPLANHIVPETDNSYTPNNTQASLCYISFTERCIEESCAILEGTITKKYDKDYYYDTYNDKFETGGIIHNKAKSVIYEIKVDKVWYGNNDFTESTYLIEDQTYNEMYDLNVGDIYVLPISNTGDTIKPVMNYASGTITRDSKYSIIYDFHPQIQVTDDGNYIVCTDWPTLIEAGSREIIFDDCSEKQSAFYQENARLVNRNNFTKQMEILIDRYFANNK